MAENDTRGKWTLPSEWAWTTIGECAQAITGTTPSKKDPSNYGNYLPLVKPPQLNDSVVSEATDNLSEKGAELARVLPPQSVLVSCIGILGKTGINSVPVAFNQQINAIVFPPEIEPRYGFYYMQSTGAKSCLHRAASATTVTIVNKSKFQRTPFPLAPLPEQRRIVAEIETQFTRLDAGVAALERAQANLKRYRASVLKTACEGRLVPTEAELARVRALREAPLHEAPDYEPADQLLARILEQRRANWEAEHPGKKYKEHALPDTEDLPELPDGWVWTTIGACAQAITGTTPSKKDPSNYGNYLPLVKPPQLNDSVVSEAADNLSEKGAGLARVLPPQSVLVSCIGILGKTGINSVPVAFNQQINAIVFPSEIEPRYGFYYMQSAGAKSWLHRMASATTVTIVNKSKFQRTPFPLAPLPEQRRIVAEVERRLSVVAVLEREVEGALARAARLRQSILKRAFEGRLLDPATVGAIRESPDYEPASALLERIRAERARRESGKTAKRTNRKKQKSPQLELL